MDRVKRWLAPLIVTLAIPSFSGALEQRTVHKRFKPEAKPSPGQVKEIARHERKRWGGPSILGRMRCESRLRWSAQNGRYKGLIQAEDYIWGYMWRTAPRRVRSTTYKKIQRKGGDLRLKIVRTGWLPKRPSQFHGWAAIRVGQRAVAGYRTTSWECGL